MANRQRDTGGSNWMRAIARWFTVALLLVAGWFGSLLAEWGFGRVIAGDGTVIHSYSGFVWWIPSVAAAVAAARLATDGPGPRRKLAVAVAVSLPVAILVRWLLGFVLA